MDSQIEIDEKTVFSNFRRFAQKPIRLFGQLVHRSLTPPKQVYVYYIILRHFLQHQLLERLHSLKDGTEITIEL